MQFEVGMVFEGKVSGITKYGAFVDLPEGKTGMIHISEVSSDFVKEITDYIKEGQVLKVKLIGINGDGKISLSIKQLEENKKNNKRNFQRRPSNRPDERNNKPRQNNTRKILVDNDGFNFRKNNNSSMSFEDMMSKFKQTSDEKISDLKKATESKRGGFSRRGSGQR